MQKTLIVIAGPTAIGKTALAIKLAQHYQTEVVSADSRQFYREMEIGTAKPSQAELDSVKHHFINSHSVTDEITVGDYETEALEVINQIFKTHSLAVLVGGSGLFIKAVTQGFDALPKAPPAVRQELNDLFTGEGILALQEKLRVLDPDYYEQVDLSNPQRLIRALEVSISTGKPFSSFRTNQPEPRPFNIIPIGLNTERRLLYHRINHRVDQMVEAGLLDEVERLIPFRHLNALNTVGYTEIFDFFDNKKSLEEAIDSIKQNTRRFAKRQLTWFRKDPEVHWFEPEQTDEIFSYISNKVR
ncbi:tRNA (adenosine(37)-N6)-dimethylallyltransferase MiaA [Paradesertivirga mongoliensis]|uniref:tRNA dimethylallyltransferase n=1 Tax=Paradesertivirga mongoliensis TaxID=2100740 RepID=A0ABW4ZL54_9SPHI|nr:tRNA (adenosine(37)-N6)-dimethylallyltransferase MiaA [Pedobacter mongoliensis]